jgi:hypothetical protein
MGIRWIGLLVLAATGCGRTFVLTIPELPFRDEPVPPKTAKGEPASPRVECNFMTVVIDYSQNGELGVAARVAHAMADEFDHLGTRVTESADEAYWSLMILAADNARKDGYVFSAMLTARNMNEGYDPGVVVFQRDSDTPDGQNRQDPPAPAVEGPRDPQGSEKPTKLATMYNGLSYGPYDALEEQSRRYVRQAYRAIFPYAQQLCAFEAADKQREENLDKELPGSPAPL